MIVTTIEATFSARDEAALREFLSALALGKSLPMTSRTQQRVRARATRRGWSYFERGYLLRGSRWRITETGRDYLRLIEGEAK